MEKLALLLVLVPVLACGPAIAIEDDSGAGADSGTGTGGADDQGMSRPSNPSTTSPPGTTTAPPSVTTGANDEGDVDDTSEVDGSEGDEGDCGCNFLCEPCQGCPDDPEWCNNGGFECDLFVQDCPLGEKCMPWANDGGPAWNATRCSPLHPSPGAPGEPCQVEGSNVSGIDNCALAATCWTVDPRTGVGTCAAMCTGTADAPQCPDGDACFIGNNGALSLCLPTCDPLVGDCLEGQGCFPADATGSAHVCLPAPTEQVIAPGTCAHIGGCEPGTVCVSPDVLPACDEPMGCCTRWCDLQAAVGCAEGPSCQPAYPGNETLGVCLG